MKILARRLVMDRQQRRWFAWRPVRCGWVNNGCSVLGWAWLENVICSRSIPFGPWQYIGNNDE
jgi:hypothetical protein